MGFAMGELWERLRHSCLFWCGVVGCTLWLLVHNARSVTPYVVSIYHLPFFHNMIDGILLALTLPIYLVVMFFAYVTDGIRYLFG